MREDEHDAVGLDPLLLTGLRRMLERLGWERFVSGPLLVHDRVCFPDAWSEDLLGLHRALRRTLLHAGQVASGVRLLDERAEGDAQPEDGLVQLAAVDEVSASFAVFGIAAPKLLLPQIALEVARLCLVRAGEFDAPYRAAQPNEAPAFPKDTAASLAEFVLGFGAIALEGSAMHLKAEGLDAGFVVGSWRRSEVGGLPSGACASVFAAQLVVRGRDEAAEVLPRLGADVRPVLEDALQDLAESAEALRRALGIPEPSQWPERFPPLEDELPADPQGEAEALQAQRAQTRRLAAPNEGGIGFAASQRHGFRGLVLGGIAGGIATALLGSVVPVLIGAAAGWLLGRHVLQSVVCSECETALGAQDERCPGCGAKIVGTIGHRDERLAAAEAYVDALEPLDE